MITYEKFCGGAKRLTLTADTTIALPTRLWIVTVSNALAKLKLPLPNPLVYRTGVPIFVLLNEPTANFLFIVDAAGNPVATQDETRVVKLALLSTDGVGVWRPIFKDRVG